MWSSGWGPEIISGYSQNESVEHKESHRCGLVGDQWVWSGGKQHVF